MTSSKRKQQTRIGLILGAMIMAYICYALIPGKFQVLDSKIIDRLFVLRSQAKPVHQRIDDRIVHIDANFYFSRSQHAIGSINNYISITHEQAGMFATIFYGILDPQRAELTYINGGHEPPIIKGPQGIKAYLAPSGPAVGLYPDLEFKVRSIALEQDDMLLVYTDGVTDARNRAGDAFTKKQLFKIVGNSSRTAEDLIDKIKSRIDEHIYGADQFDDITMVALRRK